MANFARSRRLLHDRTGRSIEGGFYPASTRNIPIRRILGRLRSPSSGIGYVAAGAQIGQKRPSTVAIPFA
jgi:hypothetical protein